MCFKFRDQLRKVCMKTFLLIASGIIWGALLTLTDRIDEHGLIGEGPLKTLLGIAGALSCGGFALIVTYYYPELFPLLAALHIYWLLQNKLNGVFILTLPIVAFGWGRFGMGAAHLPQILAITIGLLFFKITFIEMAFTKNPLKTITHKYMLQFYLVSGIIAIVFNNYSIIFFNFPCIACSFLLAGKHRPRPAEA